MSSKSSHRHGRSNQRRNHSSVPASPVRPRRLRWTAITVLGFGIMAAACWLIIRFSGNPAEQATIPADPLQANQSALTGNPTSIHRKSRSGANDKVFSAQVNRGTQLLTEGKPAEALQVLTEALRMNPEDEDVHYNLGLALTRLGKLDEAIREYGEALRIFPDYVEAHNNLGNVLMRGQRTEEAIAHFETAVRILPDYASAHNNLGTALQRVGRTNDALLHFEQAAKINPDYWEAHYNVGTSCLEAGRFDEARRELESALRLRPDFQPAKLAMAEVEARRNRGTR